MAKKFRDLVGALPPERQENIRRLSAELMAEMPLHELRRARDLSQEHLATAMKQSQSAISRLERRTDMYISTLRRYVGALGGELEIVAHFPEGSVRVDQFATLGDDESEGAAA
jgi:transcriptional regulator with XRE-family HTH domain